MSRLRVNMADEIDGEYEVMPGLYIHFLTSLVGVMQRPMAACNGVDDEKEDENEGDSVNV